MGPTLEELIGLREELTESCQFGKCNRKNTFAVTSLQDECVFNLEELQTQHS
jgi:hypothetical protein